MAWKSVFGAAIGSAFAIHSSTAPTIASLPYIREVVLITDIIGQRALSEVYQLRIDNVVVRFSALGCAGTTSFQLHSPSRALTRSPK
jgi:hypothetical protein